MILLSLKPNQILKARKRVPLPMKLCREVIVHKVGVQRAPRGYESIPEENGNQNQKDQQFDSFPDHQFSTRNRAGVTAKLNMINPREWPYVYSNRPESKNPTTARMA